MKKRLLTFFLLLSLTGTAKAQNVAYHDIALQNLGGFAKVIPSAVITVCALGSLGIPCSPPATIFSTSSGGSQLNPFNADVNGNFSFFASPGTSYVITITGVGVNGYSFPYFAPLVTAGAFGNINVGTVTSTSANPALSGFIRQASTDQICWRNNANSGDLCINKNGSDSLLFSTHLFAFLDLSQIFSGNNTFSAPIISTVSTGTAPFTISSTTLNTNLNAQFHNGLVAPGSAIVGISDSQALTNKTVTSPVFTGAATGTGAFLPVSLFNSGTGASSITFWRGDGTWASATSAPTGIFGQCGGTFNSNATTAVYGLGKNSSTSCANVETNQDFGPVMPSAGTIKNLRVKCGTAGSGAGSGVVTIHKNTAQQTMTCTVGTSTTCNDTTHTFAVVAGDQLGSDIITVGAETLANCSISVEKQ